MNALSKLILMLISLSFTGSLFSQTTTIDIYPHETRSIAGHTSLNRIKYFSISDAGNWFEAKTSDVLSGSDYFLDTLDFSFGRQFGLVHSEVNWGSTIRQDASRPGFTDTTYLRNQANPGNQGSSGSFRARFGENINVAYHDRRNAFPDFFSKYRAPQNNDEWIPQNIEAASELTLNLLQYNWNDFFKPAYFELVNEPHWSFPGDQHFADWHLDLARKARDAKLTTKIGGPCSSVAYYYRDNYQDLDNFTTFIDNTEGNLDFYSFHVYDYLSWNANENDFTGRVSTGAPVAGVIDALGGYMRKNYSKDLKMVISEHAGYISSGAGEDAETANLANEYFPGAGFEWEMERRSISNYISVSSAIANTMTFIDNPHVIEKAVPFILLETFSWNPRYYPTLLVARNFTNNNDFVESDMSHFYKFFSGASGRRVRIKCEDPDLQHHAFVEGNTMTVLFNNMSNNPHTVDLNMLSELSIDEVSIKRFQRTNDFRPNFVTEVVSGVDGISIAGREAVALELTFSDMIEEDTHIDELPFYSEEIATQVQGTKVFNVQVNNLEALSYAYLRIGLDRPVNTDQDITVKLNGTTLNVPMEDAADRFEDDRSYASLKRVYFDSDLLQTDNRVEISFPDGRSGGVGAVVIRAGLEGYFSSTDDRGPELDFTLFPNPSNGEFSIRVPADNNLPVEEVIVYNTLGMTVSSTLVEGSEVNRSINIERLPAGTYFVGLRSGKHILGMRRLVKK